MNLFTTNYHVWRNPNLCVASLSQLTRQLTLNSFQIWIQYHIEKLSELFFNISPLNKSTKTLNYLKSFAENRKWRNLPIFSQFHFTFATLESISREEYISTNYSTTLIHKTDKLFGFVFTSNAQTNHSFLTLVWYFRRGLFVLGLSVSNPPKEVTQCS